MRMRMLGVAGLVVLALGLGVYGFDWNKPVPKTSGIYSNDVKRIAQDVSSGNIAAVSASIDPRELRIVNEDSTEMSIPLPKDEFFISIAPYVIKTHPCTVHNLAKCRGEMANKIFNVRIEDSEGSVFLDQVMPSIPNGFIDLWLPRDKKFNIQISSEGRTAQSELSTFEDDNTCLTTMRLT